MDTKQRKEQHSKRSQCMAADCNGESAKTSAKNIGLQAEPSQ